MRPKRQIPYDYESYRLLSVDLKELDAPNKDWPQYRYGTVNISPAKYPSKVLKVDYRVEFTSSESARLEFAFNHPRLHKQVKHAAEAKLGPIKQRIGKPPNSKIHWYLYCTYKKHKWCYAINSALWLGKEEKFGCQNCAGIKRYAKSLEDRIIRYRKNPSLIPYILSKAGAKESQKKYALIALEKLSNKFRKMTDTYDLLTVSERIYYKKLRTVLFPPKHIVNAYTPSAKHGIPLPFQRNF